MIVVARKSIELRKFESEKLTIYINNSVGYPFEIESTTALRNFELDIQAAIALRNWLAESIKEHKAFRRMKRDQRVSKRRVAKKGRKK